MFKWSQIHIAYGSQNSYNFSLEPHQGSECSACWRRHRRWGEELISCWQMTPAREGARSSQDETGRAKPAKIKAHVVTFFCIDLSL